jgi:hypothetical protein
MGSSSSADTGPTPAWSPSQSLLGPLAQPSPSATPQSGNSNGLLSIPPYGPFFSYLEQVPPKSLLQNLGEPNRPVPRISGSEAEPFTRLLNALNPIGAAHAAEGEGPPLPPEMARALAQALLDAAAAKKLAETQDLLAKYHEATRDLFAVAQGKANGRAPRKALELSGIERPEGYAAHHIVAGDIKAAEEARTVLQKFKIDINEASNGVFLPGTTSTEIINGEAVHSTIHTKRYVAAVNEALLNAKTREQAIDILTGIAKALRSGGYP